MSVSLDDFSERAITPAMPPGLACACCVGNFILPGSGKLSCLVLHIVSTRACLSSYMYRAIYAMISIIYQRERERERERDFNSSLRFFLLQEPSCRASPCSAVPRTRTWTRAIRWRHWCVAWGSGCCSWPSPPSCCWGGAGAVCGDCTTLTCPVCIRHMFTAPAMNYSLV